MKARACLFKADPADNVATALGDLSEGQDVPVLSDEGAEITRVTLRAHVPTFFKVSLTEMRDGDVIRKWGHEIGCFTSLVYHHEDGGRETPVAVPAGTPVHVGNFTPAAALAEFWGGDLARAASAIVETYRRRGGFAPYEFGMAKRQLPDGHTIRLGDVQLHGLRAAVVPPGAGEDFVIGRARGRIAARALLRLGYCTGAPCALPGDDDTVEVIKKFYKFIKGRFYEIG
jgi:hypothetical protein